MRTDDKTLTQFTTRIRQMILEYKNIKKENAELYAMVDERDAEIAALKAQLSEAQNNYTQLKMAKMLEVTDGDMETTQKRLAKLIRDVNKCITLLSE